MRIKEAILVIVVGAVALPGFLEAKYLSKAACLKLQKNAYDALEDYNSALADSGGYRLKHGKSDPALLKNSLATKKAYSQAFDTYYTDCYQQYVGKKDFPASSFVPR